MLASVIVTVDGKDYDISSEEVCYELTCSRVGRFELWNRDNNSLVGSELAGAFKIKINGSVSFENSASRELSGNA